VVDPGKRRRNFGDAWDVSVSHASRMKHRLKIANIRGTVPALE
jgi:hypothetical protein